MRFIVLFFANFLFLAVGCVQYHYTPNLVHTPFLQKKGDLTVSAAVGGGPVTLNGDFHASYSPVKYGVVVLNYFHTRTKFEEPSLLVNSPSFSQSTKGYILEGALGVYKHHGYGTGALYVGWGQGQMRNNFGIGRIAELQLRRFFIQPTFTFQYEWFRLGMGLRIVRLNYPSGQVDYRIDPPDIEVIQKLEQATPLWFPEWGSNIGVHFAPVTITADVVVMPSRYGVDYGFDTANLGLSVSFELQELFKKGKKG